MFVVPNIKECKSYILCGLLDACHEHKLIRVLFNAEAVNKRAAVCQAYSYYIKGFRTSNERKANDELR